MIVLKLFGQYLLNMLNLLDHAGNAILLGDPNETISARTARAKNAGVTWAIHFDRLLTIGQEIVTCGKDKEDHGQYALDPKIKPNCREILDLTVWPPKIRRDPISKVMPVEID